MAERSTIDTIKVGLGLDVNQARKDVRSIGGEIVKTMNLEPRLRTPAATEITKWMDNLNTKLASATTGSGGKKTVNVPISFDGNKAVQDFKAVLDAVRAEVKPIVVPVHYVRHSDPNPPPGGGGGYMGGGGGGGGGGGPAPSAPPTRPRRTVRVGGRVTTNQQRQAAQGAPRNVAGVQQPGASFGQSLGAGEERAAAGGANVGFGGGLVAPGGGSTFGSGLQGPEEHVNYAVVGGRVVGGGVRDIDPQHDPRRTRSQAPRMRGGSLASERAAITPQQEDRNRRLGARVQRVLTKRRAQESLAAQRERMSHPTSQFVEKLTSALQGGDPSTLFESTGPEAGLADAFVSLKDAMAGDPNDEFYGKNIRQALTPFREAYLKTISDTPTRKGRKSPRQLAAIRYGQLVSGKKPRGELTESGGASFELLISSMFDASHVVPEFKKAGGAAVASGGAATTASPRLATKINELRRQRPSEATYALAREGDAEAQAEIKAWGKTQQQIATLAGITPESEKAPTPEPRSFAELAEAKRDRLARERRAASRRRAAPIWYGDKSSPGPMLAGPESYTVDPSSLNAIFNIATRQPTRSPFSRPPTWWEGRDSGGLMRRLAGAKIQSAYDRGDFEEGQRLQRELEGNLGGWGQATHPSTLGMLAQVAEEAVGITRVGEEGPEYIVHREGKSPFVVPSDHRNEFMRRLAEKSLTAKDLTSRAGGGQFEEFESPYPGAGRQLRARPGSRARQAMYGDRMYFQDIGYDRGQPAFGSYQEGRDPKVHVSATSEEALRTLEAVNKVAEEMGVAFKFVFRLDELKRARLVDSGPWGMRPDPNVGTFGPGGAQQGKFITAYPRPEQAKEFTEAVYQALKSAGVGADAAVAPSEIRYADDAPITHRSSGGDRYGAEGGYTASGEGRDRIGRRQTTRRRRRRRGYGGGVDLPGGGYFDPMTGEYRVGANGPAMLDPGANQDPYEGPTVPQVEDIDDGNYPGGGDAGWEWDPQEGGGGEGPPDDGGWTRDYAGKWWPPGEQPTNRDVGPAGLRPVGVGGPWEAGRATLAAKANATGSAMSMSVQRVHVVNFSDLVSLMGSEGAFSPPTREPARGRGRRLSVAEDAVDVDVSGAGGGGGGGTRQGLGQTTTRSGGTRLSDLEARTASRVSAEEQMSSFAERLDKVGIDISDALQQSPVRALSVSIGQIAQQMIGGRSGIQERARLAGAARQSAAQSAVQMRNLIDKQAQAEFMLQTEGPARFGISGLDEVQNLPEEQQKEATKYFQDAAASFDEATRAIEGGPNFRGQRSVQEERTALAEAFARGGTVRAKQLSEEQRRAYGVSQTAGDEEEVQISGIMTRGQQLKTQAVGVGGIVGGTMLFTAAMTAANVAMQSFSTVAKDGVDALTGFSFTARRVMDEMSRSYSGQGTRAEEVTAERAAALGISSGFNLGNIGEMAQRRAGVENQLQAMEMSRAQRFYEQNAGQGLTTGFGNGIFGTFLNQTPAAVETMAGQLEAPRDYYDVRERVRAEMPNPEASNQLAGAQDFAEWVAGGGPLNSQPLEKRTAERDRIEAQREAETQRRLGMEDERLAVVNMGIAKEWTDTVRRFEKFVGQVETGEFTTNATQEDIDTWVAALKKAGVSDSAADEWGNKRVIGRTRTGEVMTDKQDILRILDAFTKGRTIPDAQGLLKSQQQGIEAQMANITRQAGFQRQLTGANFYRSTLTQPFLGSDVSPMAGVTAPGVSGGPAAKYGSSIRETRAELEKIQEMGRQNFLDLFPPERREGVQKMADTIGTLGQEILDLQRTSEDLQLGMEQEQYNEQLYQSKRTLSDLVGLSGQQADSVAGQTIQASRLGQLQRAQMMDARELSRIQLARSQRELNLQLALSRLQAPGETPEERAVRRREAMLKAREQQAELDIGKRSTTRGWQIEDIGIGRSLRDAGKQLELMMKQREVTIEVRGIQKLVEGKQQLMSVKDAYLGVAQQAATELQGLELSLITELEKVLGTDGSIPEEVDKFLGSMQEKYQVFWNDLFDVNNGGEVAIFGAGGPNIFPGANVTFHIEGTNLKPQEIANEVAKILHERYRIANGTTGAI